MARAQRRVGPTGLAAVRERLPRNALWDRFVKRYFIALALSCVVIIGGIAGVNANVNSKLGRIHSVKGLTLAKEPQAHSGNFLVIGSDSRGFVHNSAQAQAFGNPQQQSGQRSDTIMIAHVDASQKRVLVVSLPRDTEVDIPGMGRQKINAAFNAGPQRLIDTIQSNFHITINHYIEVGFDSFAGIVDAIGHVPVSFPAPAFDVCTGLYVPLAGVTQLNGTEALQYVRSRHLQYYRNGSWHDASPRADLDRIARQQGFIRQLATLAFHKAETDIFAANDIANSVVDKLGVDDALAKNHSDLLEFVRVFRDVNPADTTAFQTMTLPVQGEGTTTSPLILQQPDADELFQQLNKFGGPLPLSRNLQPSQVSVRVLNGTGVTGKAADTLRQLQTFGFVSAGVGDTAATTQTEVHYRPEALAAGRTVQTYLGGVGQLVDDPNLPNASVVVVLGTDFKQAMTPADLLLGIAAQNATSTSTSSTTSTTDAARFPKPPRESCPQT
ncbi:MAG: LCP family protein [Actinobacteria bacterium]|nr:LCP family protein [Actinomycetota bacterium]